MLTSFGGDIERNVDELSKDCSSDKPRYAVDCMSGITNNREPPVTEHYSRIVRW